MGEPSGRGWSSKIERWQVLLGAFIAGGISLLIFFSTTHSGSASTPNSTGASAHSVPVSPTEPTLAASTSANAPVFGATVVAPTPTSSGHSGALVLKVDFGSDGEVGVDTYRNPMHFGWTSTVYDNSGALDSGCYISWTLYQGTEVVYKYSTVCNNNPLSTMFLGPGTYHFVGDITTDWGATGSGSADFSVAGD